jgi:hypothetical protein
MGDRERTDGRGRHRGWLDHNWAIGGAGGKGGSRGNGTGGRIVVLAGRSTVTRRFVTSNLAVGGAGGQGGDGGAARVGGIANLAGAMLALDSDALFNNQATWGDDLNGRDGLGGELYNLGTASLTKSFVNRNRAKGGSAGAGGLDGVALSGGVDDAGGISIDALTVICGNTPDNRYG